MFGTNSAPAENVPNIYIQWRNLASLQINNIMLFYIKLKV